MNRKMRRAQSREIDRQNRLGPQPSQTSAAPAPISSIIASRFAEAVRCQQAGQLVEAIALYDRVTLLNPNIPEIHNNRGVALAALERFAEAERAYRQAVALNPDYADAFNNLGNALCQLGRLDEAEQAMRCAIRVRPDMARPITNLGLVLKSQNRLNDAEAAHREAIALDPKFAEAYHNLGDTLCRLGRLEEAEKNLRYAISLDSNYAEALVNLAIVLKAQSRLREAETMCRQAIALKPQLAHAYNTLGNIILDLRRFDDAEKALRHAVALRPHFAEAMSNLGNVLKEQGKLAEAETVYRQAIALNSRIAEAHYNLAGSLSAQDRLVEAEAAYRHAIAINPDFADAHNNLGVTLKFLGRFAEARRSAERALQLAPQDPTFHFNLAELKRFAIGDPDLAVLEELARNARTLPVKKQVDLHFALAKAYEDVGDRDGIIRHLLAGNALMRGQIDYDENPALREMGRTAQIFTPQLLGALASAGEPSSKPVFILGMPRSGTSLIEQILASHPQVFGGGELPILNAVAGCLGAFAGRPGPFPDVMAHVSPRDLQRAGAHYVAEIDRMAPDAARVVDKMPSNFRLAGLIHLILPNARIIHTVRDPLDTCFSCFSKLFSNGQHQTYDLAELGRYYRHYQNLMEHWRQLLPPGRIMDVRYEDVVTDLEGQARRIVAHCGLEWDERCLAFHNTERPVHTASALQVRQPIYQSASGRAQPFRQHLAPLLDALSAP
jgi:Flp pilus assembly protein TadD